MRRNLALFTLALLASAAALAAEPATSPLAPAATGGVAALDRALARLATHRRLLVIAAHPDDEDTALLTLVSRGMGGEAAYLALSRGEGGQNLIGPELGVGLGLLRTRELLAAREVDGARQYFTRAYDFGYTRSLEETLRRWPKPVLLEDAVRVVRRFKPQVLVSVFPPDGRAGHGQHQAAGVVAHEVMALAGDPDALPQLAREGLAPWRPAALYRSAWFDPDAATLTLATGRLEPLTGRSLFQLAMASRSMHRSQDMGSLQEPGPRTSRLAWVAGVGEGEAEDLFAGIDTRLAGIAATLPEGEGRRAIEAHLARVEGLAEEARRGLAPVALGAAVAPLARILGELRQAQARLAGDGGAEQAVVADLLAEKLAVAEEALAVAAGVAVDATVEQEAWTAGESGTVRAVLWNGGGEALTRVEVVPRSAWRVEPAAAPPVAVEAGALEEWTLAAEVPREARPTVPYFLEGPLDGDLYDWREVPGEVRGEPFGPAPLAVEFRFAVAGVEVSLEREVVHRYRDQALGEVRRPLRVVPPVEVAADPDLIVWPTATGGRRTVEVRLAARAPTDLAGRLEVEVPAGWPAVPPRPFAIPAGGQVALGVEVEAPRPLPPGRATLRLAAVLADGTRHGLAVPLVDHPHVPPTPLPQAAAVAVSAADLRLPPLARVGYVRGASDRVPEALAQVGVPIALLSARELATGDLAAYDAIVVGSRAYEAEPGLAGANPRLLDYVRGGGLLIVQYQQYPFVRGGYAPFPLDIARPHGRVTDETAPIQVLVPDHPAFTTPNPIGPEDWRGWVQERGLYFAGTWDPAYTPLLALADPGGAEQRGALLAARLGQGTYVYTGLAFFRQLPAGVAGAYRLFANLLALGR